jgi:hypothetical protein
VQGKIDGNIFTTAERRLLLLFYSGNASDTAETLCQALPDIHDSDERAAAAGLIAKLDGMDETALAEYISESEVNYV